MIENFEFLPGENFELIDLFEITGTNYLLNSCRSCEKICNSKAFVEIATPAKNRGLNTIYNRRKLLHQSRPGRDVELQNTHTVLFKSPREVIQASKLNAQLRFGSQIADVYQDATSVHYGHLLIDLSPRREDQICFRKKTESFRLMFFITDPGETSKIQGQ